MSEVKQELQEVVNELKKEGVDLNNYTQKDGLGDVVESVLNKMGITEEKVQAFMGIGGCGCQEVKKFLNKIILPIWKKS
jgi:ABC-type phosphate transport system ATPase subunit